MNLRIAKMLAGSTAAGALLLSGGAVTFAQTYANPDGTGALVPQSSIVSGSNPSTATGSVTGNPGTGVTSGTGVTNTATTGTTGAAQPKSSTGPTGSVTTPGIPNTGTGGTATASFAVLAVSALAAVGAAAYLARQRIASLR